MAKRPRPASTAPRRLRPQFDVVRSSIYLPAGVYEALREVAYEERRKIHDLILEGIGAALKKRGYPAVDELRRKKAP
jgi:hypothetical protein